MTSPANSENRRAWVRVANVFTCKTEGQNGTCLPADRHCLWQRPSCGSAKQALFRNIKQVSLTLLFDDAALSSNKSLAFHPSVLAAIALTMMILSYQGIDVACRGRDPIATRALFGWYAHPAIDKQCLISHSPCN